MRWLKARWLEARWLQAGLAVTLLAATLAQPVRAEQRWLGCTYKDANGKQQNFLVAFDDLRGVAALLDAGSLVEGTNTSITFQALRTRFPEIAITYNRNDGALTVNPRGGGILGGECRRVAPPPGAPTLP
ncbi:MAG: hypothetical protein JOY64_06290 [Alphaproteobacteria bacterium]|nr:hypothetical protein [Alphaproteobacteria bacterium]MBV8407220.1 hypothetical protein [Alphaproteobacteria bacterium]